MFRLSALLVAAVAGVNVEAQNVQPAVQKLSLDLRSLSPPCANSVRASDSSEFQPGVHSARRGSETTKILSCHCFADFDAISDRKTNLFTTVKKIKQCHSNKFPSEMISIDRCSCLIEARSWERFRRFMVTNILPLSHRPMPLAYIILIQIGCSVQIWIEATHKSPFATISPPGGTFHPKELQW